jgi:acyl-CoA thioester hydrolase
MPRATIQLPDSFHFTTQISLRITDINYGGHLGNDALLAILQEARIRFLKSHNYNEKDIEGCGIIMADAVIIYKSQAFYGDILEIRITAADFSKRACDLLYMISNTATGKEVARAKTRIAFFDYAAGHTVSVPEKFKTIFIG